MMTEPDVLLVVRPKTGYFDFLKGPCYRMKAKIIKHLPKGPVFTLEIIKHVQNYQIST